MKRRHEKMDQATAKLHWNNYVECMKNGTQPMFSLHEYSEYYKKQANNQKWRKAAEAKKRKAERKGIRITRSDQMTEHKARAIKRFAEQGLKRWDIADRLGISYDQVDSVLRGLTWKQIQ